MKAHYEKGGLGDMVCKRYLNEVLQETLAPIRERRKELEKNIEAVKKIYQEGSIKARKVAMETLKRIRKNVGVEYFG